MAQHDTGGPENRSHQTVTKASGISSLSLGLPRGGRAGRRGPNEDQESTAKALPAERAQELAVRATDNDAMGSRLSAMMQKYIPHDIFTGMLASSQATTSATLARRSPIINIGTYLRCRAIDQSVGHFLASGGSSREKQIISLGAGSDARFWRLQTEANGLADGLLHYVELDFADLTSAKLQRIRRHEALRSALHLNANEATTSSDDSLQTARYSLFPCDLRTLPNDDTIKTKLQAVLDPNVDTLIIAECVLAYLSQTQSTNLLRYLCSYLRRPFVVCYEMCVAGDGLDAQDGIPSRFGQVMLANLKQRNLLMPGARPYATLQSHARRFHGIMADDANADGTSKVQTLCSVWRALDAADRARISKLEGLDEVEELEMLLSHYAISWYAYDGKNVLYKDFIEAADKGL